MSYEKQPECFCVEHGLHIETLKAQLAEAVEVLNGVKNEFSKWSMAGNIGKRVDEFLARHAQAEQKEARAALATQPVVKKTLDEMRNTREWLYGYRAALNAASLEFRRADGTPGKVSKRLLELRRETFTQPAV